MLPPAQPGCWRLNSAGPWPHPSRAATRKGPSQPCQERAAETEPGAACTGGRGGPQDVLILKILSWGQNLLRGPRKPQHRPTRPIVSLRLAGARHARAPPFKQRKGGLAWQSHPSWGSWEYPFQRQFVLPRWQCREVLSCPKNAACRATGKAQPWCQRRELYCHSEQLSLGCQPLTGREALRCGLCLKVWVQLCFTSSL